ncbi:MAG TPA: molybdenum cofactor biosynthesis protein MoaE [Chthoniobacterales bacterium]|nr:molybdenum cofactor biosynthesis protein MoaE [Chthoniobacterales bacterium]
MANSVCDVLLTQTRLAAPAGEIDPSAGAIVDFWGVVRKLEDGREIEGIDYEAHGAMAEHQLAMIAQQAAARFELRCVIIRHRVGFVAVGEASLFLEVAAGHRGAAFEASKWIVDELKRKVPIWKHPRFKVDPVKTAARSATAATVVSTK